MDSRERCLRAIELREVDVIPTVLRCRVEVLASLETKLGVKGFDEVCEVLKVDVRFGPSIGLKSTDAIDEIRMQQAELLADAGVDVVVDGDDVGAQRSMIVSPSLWRQILKPRYHRLIQVVKRKGAKFLFHSDGWIESIVPDLSWTA